MCLGRDAFSGRDAYDVKGLGACNVMRRKACKSKRDCRCGEERLPAQHKALEHSFGHKAPKMGGGIGNHLPFLAIPSQHGHTSQYKRLKIVLTIYQSGFNHVSLKSDVEVLLRFNRFN